MTPNNYVLGIDASLTNTGVCFLSNSPIYSLTSIKGGKLRGAERLHFFYIELEKLIDKWKPKSAMIEGYAYAVGNKGHTYNIGELGGIIRLLLYNKKIPLDVVSPPSVKKFATGRGVCDKNLILKEVYRKWALDVTSDDLADGYVIAKIAQACYYVRNNIEITLTKYEREVVDKILKGKEENGN